ncbi:MAG TPA: ABC transporter permease [Micromonosporaceae bacterium]
MTIKQESGGGSSPDRPGSVGTEPDADPIGATTEAAGPDAEARLAGREAAPPRRSRLRTFADRASSANPVTVTVLAIVTSLVIGAILIVLANEDVRSTWGYFFAAPGAALSASWGAISEAYANLFTGSVVDPSAVTGAFDGSNSWQLALAPISETLTYTAPLIFTGLSVALAFRGGLFNIGGQGQVIFGTIGAALIGFGLHLPWGLHMLLAVIGGAIGGGLYGYIPGALKARTGAHEVIVTIMLNYVALYFLAWLIVQRGVHDPTRSDAISKKVDSTAMLWSPPGLRVNFGIVLAILAVIFVGWLLNRSTVGFELRAVGSNPDAARTAGMSVGRTFILVMMIAGGLAGLGGATMVLGTAQSLTGQVAGSVGFDGITVALLGRGKPWGVALAALLFGALSAGGRSMQSAASVPIDLVNLVEAVIVIFIAAPALVSALFRLREDRSARLMTNLAKGW